MRSSPSYNLLMKTQLNMHILLKKLQLLGKETQGVISLSRKIEEVIWELACIHIQENGYQNQINWFQNLNPVSQVSDRDFLDELAWCVFNSGMREQVIRKKWPLLRPAFCDFVAANIIQNETAVFQGAMAIFGYAGKVNAVITAAKRVITEGPMGPLLARMSEEQLLVFLESFPFIGPVTKFHLARNIGVDVVKPDRHMVRLANYAGFASPRELVDVIAGFARERIGVIDYALWQWLADRGADAHRDIQAGMPHKK
jgi:hypothetical protein